MNEWILNNKKLDHKLLFLPLNEKLLINKCSLIYNIFCLNMHEHTIQIDQTYFFFFPLTFSRTCYRHKFNLLNNISVWGIKLHVIGSGSFFSNRVFPTKSFEITHMNQKSSVTIFPLDLFLNMTLYMSRETRWLLNQLIKNQLLMTIFIQEN